jgi:hypothetical protein
MVGSLTLDGPFGGIQFTNGTALFDSTLDVVTVKNPLDDVAVAFSVFARFNQLRIVDSGALLLDALAQPTVTRFVVENTQITDLGDVVLSGAEALVLTDNPVLCFGAVEEFVRNNPGVAQTFTNNGTASTCPQACGDRVVSSVQDVLDLNAGCFSATSVLVTGDAPSDGGFFGNQVSLIGSDGRGLTINNLEVGELTRPLGLLQLSRPVTGRMFLRDTGAFLFSMFGGPGPLGQLRLTGTTAPFSAGFGTLPFDSIGVLVLSNTSLNVDQVLSMLPAVPTRVSNGAIIENNPNLCDVNTVLSRLGLSPASPGLIISNNGTNCP